MSDETIIKEEPDHCSNIGAYDCRSGVFELFRKNVSGKRKDPGSKPGTCQPGIVAEAKVAREQTRSQNKEMLMGIIDDANLGDEQKQDAIAQMIMLTDLAEKETTVETLLKSKGFSEAVVSLTKDSADVVINSSQLSEINRAQIEDIVSRKAGIAPENIVITPIRADKTSETEAENEKTEKKETDQDTDKEQK